MYDETLGAEIDRALDFYSMLVAEPPPATAPEREAAYVAHFCAWLHRQRPSLYSRVFVGVVEKAIDQRRLSQSSPIDQALAMLVDCELTPRLKSMVQARLWDAVAHNWAAHEPPRVSDEECLFVLEQ